MSHLRAFLHQIKGSIIIADPWLIPKIRDKDSFLMEDFIKTGYNSTELRTLNNCRLYLQVTTIAAISDHTGECLLPNAFVQGKQTPLITMSRSTLNWPHQPNPALPAWKLWTQAIQCCYTKPGLPHHLQQHLGPWLPAANRTQIWHTLYHPLSKQISIDSPELSKNYRVNTTTRSHFNITPTILRVNHNSQIHPVCIEVTRTSLRVDHRIQPIPDQPQIHIAPPHCIPDARIFNSLPSYAPELWSQFAKSDGSTSKALAHHLQSNQGTTYIVSVASQNAQH